MITENYQKFWGKAAKEQDYKKYILPGRTEAEFWEEGKRQALGLAPWFKDAETVVEFGCGVGRVLQNVKAKNRIGVDVSREFLTIAAKAGIQPLLSDGLTIDLPDDIADVVYSLMVFQHCPKSDHVKQIAEMYRICKPGGTILIQFPRKESGYYKESTFVNVYDHDEITNMIKLNFPGAKYYCGMWALAGYADGKKSNREWLLTIEK